MHFDVIPARSVCLTGEDVVNPYLVISASVAIGRMGYSNLPCASKYVRESELVFFSTH